MNIPAALFANPEGSQGQQQSPYPEGAQPGAQYAQGFLQNILQILQGFQQAHTGEGNPFESPASFDTSPIAKMLGPLFASAAWHGSPYRGIKQMSKAAIGSGEGGAAFGHGFYFSGLKDVAQHYRDNLAPVQAFEMGGGKWALRERASGKLLDETGKPTSYEKAKIFDSKQEADKLARKGALYKADIPDETSLLQWDKPLSEQPEKVKEALEKAGFSKNFIDFRKDLTGGTLYQQLARGEGMPTTVQYAGSTSQAASEYLHSIGIPGHSYPSGTLTGAPSGSTPARNYVIYSDEPIKILEEH